MAISNPYAFVTLVSSDAYLPGALALVAALKDVHPSPPVQPEVEFQTVCLVTPESVDVASIKLLRRAFNLVIGVELIVQEDDKALALLGRPDLNSVLTKLHIFRLTQYSKIIFLDADVLPIRPLSHLFTLPHEFAAVPDVGWPDIFNSGVLVVAPGEDKFNEVRQVLESKGSWDGGDQGVLNEWRGANWHRLSFTYNTTPTAAYTYAPAYERFGSNIKAIHFIGPNKPWNSIPWRAAGTKNGGKAELGPQQTYDYSSLVDRWYEVYDRHYRSEVPSSRVDFEYQRYESVWDDGSSFGAELASRGSAAPPPGGALGLDDLRKIALEGYNSGSGSGGRSTPSTPAEVPTVGEYRSLPLDGRVDLMRPKKEQTQPAAEWGGNQDPQATPRQADVQLPGQERFGIDTLPTPGPNEVPPAPYHYGHSLPPTASPTPYHGPHHGQFLQSSQSQVPGQEYDSSEGLGLEYQQDSYFPPTGQRGEIQQSGVRQGSQEHYFVSAVHFNETPYDSQQYSPMRHLSGQRHDSQQLFFPAGQFHTQGHGAEQHFSPTGHSMTLRHDPSLHFPQADSRSARFAPQSDAYSSDPGLQPEVNVPHRQHHHGHHHGHHRPQQQHHTSQSQQHPMTQPNEPHAEHVKQEHESTVIQQQRDEQVFYQQGSSPLRERGSLSHRRPQTSSPTQPRSPQSDRRGHVRPHSPPKQSEAPPPFHPRYGHPRSPSPPKLSWNPAIEPPPKEPPPAASAFPVDTYFPNIWDQPTGARHETGYQPFPSPKRSVPKSDAFFQPPPPPTIPEQLIREGQYANVLGPASPPVDDTTASPPPPTPDVSKVRTVFTWEERPRHMPRRVFPAGDAPSPSVVYIDSPGEATSPKPRSTTPTSSPPDRALGARRAMSPPLGLTSHLAYSNAWDTVPSIKRYATRLVRPTDSAAPMVPPDNGWKKWDKERERDWQERQDASSMDGDDEDESDEESDTRVEKHRARASSLTSNRGKKKEYRARGVQTTGPEMRSQSVQVATLRDQASGSQPRSSRGVGLGIRRDWPTISSTSGLLPPAVLHDFKGASEQMAGTPTVTTALRHTSVPFPSTASPTGLMSPQTLGSPRTYSPAPSISTSSSMQTSSPLRGPSPLLSSSSAATSSPRRVVISSPKTASTHTSRPATVARRASASGSSPKPGSPVVGSRSGASTPSPKANRLSSPFSPQLARSLSVDTNVTPSPSTTQSSLWTPDNTPVIGGGPMRKGGRVWDPARGVDVFKRGSEEVLARFLRMGSTSFEEDDPQKRSTQV